MNAQKSAKILFIAIGLLGILGCQMVTNLFEPGEAPDPLQAPEFQPEDLPDPAQTGEFQLQGIWESSVDSGFGSTMYIELILEHTGTFSQQVVLGDLMTYDVGRYEVGDGFIHFVVEKHEPTEYQGQPMTWVNSFTYFYTVVDANTMILEDHIQGSTWTAYRR